MNQKIFKSKKHTKTVVVASILIVLLAGWFLLLHEMQPATLMKRRIIGSDIFNGAEVVHNDNDFWTLMGGTSNIHLRLSPEKIDELLNREVIFKECDNNGKQRADRGCSNPVWRESKMFSMCSDIHQEGFAELLCVDQEANIVWYYQRSGW
jgi:hypothetical protein